MLRERNAQDKRRMSHDEVGASDRVFDVNFDVGDPSGFEGHPSVPSFSQF